MLLTEKTATLERFSVNFDFEQSSLSPSLSPCSALFQGQKAPHVSQCLSQVARVHLHVACDARVSLRSHVKAVCMRGV